MKPLEIPVWRAKLTAQPKEDILSLGTYFEN